MNTLLCSFLCTGSFTVFISLYWSGDGGVEEAGARWQDPSQSSLSSFSCAHRETDLKERIMAVTVNGNPHTGKMAALTCFLFNGSALILLPQNLSQCDPKRQMTTLTPMLHSIYFTLAALSHPRPYQSPSG